MKRKKGGGGIAQTRLGSFGPRQNRIDRISGEGKRVRVIVRYVLGQENTIWSNEICILFGSSHKFRYLDRFDKSIVWLSKLSTLA